MPELRVDVEVWCECGEGLCHQSSPATHGVGVVVEPCEKCKDAAKEEGDNEGYDRGYKSAKDEYAEVSLNDGN